MSKLTKEEKKARKFLEQYNLAPERFTEEENRSWGRESNNQVKLPDFKVPTPDGWFFYCEVKSLQHAPETESLSFNMFGKHIAKAVNQFEVVNSSLIVPNVLLWVNYEPRNHFDNLQMIYTGVVGMPDGISIPGYQRYAEGKIKETKWNIDLHIWLDVDDGTVRSDGLVVTEGHHWFFSGSGIRPDYREKLVRLFGINPRSINHI